jgi:tetratricopeptide (TPR) repeat protein
LNLAAEAGVFLLLYPHVAKLHRRVDADGVSFVTNGLALAILIPTKGINAPLATMQRFLARISRLSVPLLGPAFAILLLLASAARAAVAGGGAASNGRGYVGFATHPDNPLEKRLWADAADGRLDDFSPLAAALVAGGVDNQRDLQRYEQKAAALVEKLHRSENLAGTPREQIEAIFKFLHQKVLYAGYDLAYTDLRRVLDEGRFNCISAVVVFGYLADRCGLDCRGLEMPGHAACRVLTADGPIEVETTCPRWFSLSEAEKSRIPACGNRSIGAASPPDRTKAREVSPIQLAAMIYYNRGVDFLAEKHFAEAAAANAKALRLDPANATARGNLLATLNNWSIELVNSNRFDEAVQRLRQGMALDPQFAPFTQNFIHVHHQWAEDLCRTGRFDEAASLLSRAASEMPGRDDLRRLQTEVSHRRTQANFSNIKSAPTANRLPAAEVLELQSRKAGL